MNPALLSSVRRSVLLAGVLCSLAVPAFALKYAAVEHHIPADPKLVEIKAVTVNKKRLSEFNLNLAVKRAQLKEAPKAPAKGPAPAPAKKG